MRNRLVLSIILITAFIMAIPHKTEAGEVLVKGKAESFGGGQIRAYVYSDLITYKHKRVGDALIDKSDEFILNLDLDHTQYLILKIEDKKTALLAEPGMVYNLNLSYSEERNQGNIYDKRLSISFSFPRPDDLNQLVKKYNNEYEAFLADNYKKFAQKSTAKIISDFRKKMLKKYNSYDKPYFKNYVRYSLASLEEATKKNDVGFYDKYLKDQPILFRNVEYMRFFNQLYEDKFKSYVISTDIGLKLMGAINYYCNYDSVKTLLDNKPILNNDTLLQMVVLKGIKDLYYNSSINLKKPKMLKMLRHLEANGICGETRTVAANIIDDLTHFKKGSKAPGFVLKDEKGQNVSLKDFRGKYIYLSFWASWNIPSLKELKVMNKLHKQYGDHIAFISISTDRDIAEMQKTLSKNNYGWTFLHIGKNKELMDDYEANIIPRYYLIDKSGKFISAPAERPTGKIEKKLYELSRQR